MNDEREATPAATLEEYITNPCIPKNENEWWASREIERLRVENEKLREALAAERERCAKIAERYLSNNEPVRLTASSIAAAIRESGDE